MEGVEILNVIESHFDVWLFLWSTICLGLGIFFLIGAWLSFKDTEIVTGVLLLLLGAFIFFVGIMGYCSPMTQTKYEVTISDEVNFNEFNEHYKIIEQKEKIFVIEEREK